MENMRRKTFIVAGAIGIVALATGLLALTRLGAAQAIRTTALPATITIGPDVGETFAPQPASAAPSLTAAQACARWRQQVGGDDTMIPGDATVQLGLLTLPVGPDCGADCSKLTIKNDIAYTALNELAYGYSTPCSPEAAASTGGSCLPAECCPACQPEAQGTESLSARFMSAASRHRHPWPASSRSVQIFWIVP